MDLLVKIIVPPKMPRMKHIHIECWSSSMKESCSCKLHGIAQKWEIKVCIAIYFELSCSVARYPCFCIYVIM